MKLLLVNYEFPPIGGGAATATRELARSLSKNGCDVTVLTTGVKGAVLDEEDSSYSVVRLKTGRRNVSSCSMLEMAVFVMVAGLSLPKLLFRNGYDGAVLFFGVPCGFLGPVLRFVFKVPYIISLRGGDVPGNEPSLDRVHKLLTPVRHFIYRNALRVTANSKGLKEKSQKVDYFPVDIIPNGVDCKRFHHSPPATRQSGQILFVGRLVDQKNVGVLLRAFALLEGRCSLDIIGDGPLRQELEDLARKLNIEDRVNFHGWLSRGEVTRFYQNSTLLVLPSKYEGMSNVLLEAMGAALPVVVTDVEGTRELVEDNGTGLVIPVDDHQAAAKAIQRLVNESVLRQRLGSSARTLVESQFSWKKVALSHIELFEQC